MKKQPGRPISIIGVPLDLGAGRSGAGIGPNAIRYAGVVERLEQLGCFVMDEGDLTVKGSNVTSTKQPNTKLKHLDEIVKVNEELSTKIGEAMAAGHFPLILGGDHSIAIGTLAGVRKSGGQYGLIWFDAHTDVNTGETTPTGNIHGMSLAVALGYGDPRLTSIGGGTAFIKPEHTVIVGARSIDPGERKFLKKLGVRVFTIRDVERLGIAKVMERALKIAARGTDGIHLSLDLDGLDPHDAPGVGTPVPGGLSLRESLLAMELISEAGVAVSAEFVEVNPTLDLRNKTARAAVDLIGALFGERII
ncbi:arginase [Paenibacillus radicis (ex Xue et al. 2023)]|uniref:Arginase n=1 Tax=Paenibacillus radicis (ex Xue et al. 2023) TaxID=2972489 RepID=A0ABT1YUC7_9BACL|nr:arginase [Paenibacillus radicis (ex Xue et al. 2023)]MCR8635685.1 arginase [Paenibacillus radicis (ex Xue et al. 2023)]